MTSNSGQEGGVAVFAGGQLTSRDYRVLCGCAWCGGGRFGVREDRDIELHSGNGVSTGAYGVIRGC